MVTVHVHVGLIHGCIGKICTMPSLVDEVLQQYIMENDACDGSMGANSNTDGHVHSHECFTRSATFAKTIPRSYNTH
jgi:hypothetical protein